jgi:histidine kinase
LVFKVLVSVGAVLLLSLALWGYLSASSYKEKTMDDLTENIGRLGETIRLGLHYAMMINARSDIEQIIKNIARQNDIESVRIYNKSGRIKYSSHPDEVDLQTNIKAEACYICHKSEPPIARLALKDRVRIFQSTQGYRLMGIISPVYNDKGCASGCHIHPPNKQVLGALDLVVSLKDVDREIASQQRNLAVLALVVFAGTALIVIFIIMRFVTRPIGKLIKGTRCIEEGDLNVAVQINQEDEMQELARAINQMAGAIGEKTAALNRQRDEFQTLFETVPCIISVQDRDYRLINYNHEFARRFEPRLGEYCYKVYKGRDEKCEVCPVEKTFEDGKPHYSEESGQDKDGTVKHWIVRTSPIRDARGEVVAAMEMNLDITERKQLEQKLAQSQKKYSVTFNNIPNPVFVLDPHLLDILDYNNSVSQIYGYDSSELIGQSFLTLFWNQENEPLGPMLKNNSLIERAKHRAKDGQMRYVTIRISPSEYGDQQVLLVTISDITKRLEAEQQLIQASKMATLGEMATGVAHELNQPLSVIKTASNFFMRKVRKKESITEEVMGTMAKEIDSHVERASKIINHMRLFGRRSDEMHLVPVQINSVLTQAFEIFSQQLKVRGIEVVWDVQEDLPEINGDHGRLEQVFINLLINARDAIEERYAVGDGAAGPKQIRLTSARCGQQVVVEVCDTGTGIPETHLEKIFEPFFTTKKVGQGTGLGLSISYGIVQECGGRIDAKANPDGGACFILKFPISAES